MKEVILSKGAHNSRDEGLCAMEFGAYLAGLEHTDRPACVSSVLQTLMIGLNDNMDGETRQRLRPYISRTLGTAGDGQDARREYIAADWAVRECAPAALSAAGLDDEAQMLRSLAPIESEASACVANAVAYAAAANAAAAVANAANAAATNAAAAAAAAAAATNTAAAAAAAAYAYAADAAAGACVWESAFGLLDRIIDPGGIHALKSEAEWLESGVDLEV